MKTAQLLALLKAKDTDTYEIIKVEFERKLAEVQKIERIKKMGGVNPLAKPIEPQLSQVTAKDMAEAWKLIDSELKYNQFKGRAVHSDATAEQASQPKITETTKPAPLVHAVRDRARPTGRRLPAKYEGRKTTAKSGTKEQNPVGEETTTKVLVTDTPIIKTPVIAPHKSVGTKPKAVHWDPAIPPTQSERRAALQRSPQPTADSLNDAIVQAVAKYTQYHTKDTNKKNIELNRGQGAGFFSFLRHGAKGLAVANRFNQEVRAIESVDAKVALLKKFLGDSSRAYHHHSFTSYLADALAEQGLVKSHAAKRYSQNDVVKELEQWLTENSSTNSLRIQ